MDSPQPKVTPPSEKKGRGCLFFIVGFVIVACIGFFLLIALAIGIPAYVKYKERAASVTASGTSQNDAPMIPSLSERKPPEPEFILKQLYPKGTWKNGRLHREAPLPESATNEETPPEDRVGDNITSVAYAVPFAQNGIDKVFVIMGSVPTAFAIDGDEDAYPQSISPTLGAAILKWDGNNWIIESQNDDMGDIGGSYGAMPSGRIAEIGQDRYGFLLDGGWSGRGYSISSAVLVGQTQDATLTILAHIPLSQSNVDVGLAPEESYSFDSEIKFITDEPSAAYYPISVTRTGSCKGKSGNIVPVKLDTVFIMGSDGYAPKGGVDSLESLCETSL